jgi:hypothetical protein
MRMGQVGPRTVLKWRIRGMRFVRKRVSIITAALVVLRVVRVVAGTMVPGLGEVVPDLLLLLVLLFGFEDEEASGVS